MHLAHKGASRKIQQALLTAEETAGAGAVDAEALQGADNALHARRPGGGALLA